MKIHLHKVELRAVIHHFLERIPIWLKFVYAGNVYGIANDTRFRIVIQL